MSFFLATFSYGSIQLQLLNFILFAYNLVASIGIHLEIRKSLLQMVLAKTLLDPHVLSNGIIITLVMHK
ncbi:hypothetical protein RJT34_31624 [Clitoria ternatea]|uniref:Uncharacterized protein n=1 Tax=Clitoria ternatea TaxID=43366 RepID=A0AAN9I313_CLITE